MGSANDTGLQPDALGNLTVAFWCSFDTLPTNGVYTKLVDVDGGSAATDLWAVQYDGSLNQFAWVNSNGTAYHQVAHTATLAANHWYLFAATASQAPTIQFNIYDAGGVLAGGGSTSGGLRLGGSVAALKVGGGLSGSTWSHVRIDSLGIWQSVLSGSDVTALLAGAKGLRGSQLQTALAAQPSRWYDFDQAAGSLVYPDLSGAHALAPQTQAGGAGFVSSTPPRGSF